MNFINKIGNKSKDNKSRSVIGLMGSCVMHNILYIFLNTFMVAYFITLTNYDYKKISIFYALSFLFLLLSFLLLGKTVKNKSKVGIFRVGILLHCVYVLLLSLLKDKIVDYYILLGILYGIVQGFFWLPVNSLLDEYLDEDSDKYMFTKSTFDNIFKILFPFLFGVSIQLTSFSYIAKIVLILGVIQFLFSLLVKEKNNVKQNKYNLREFYRKFKENELFKNYYRMVYCDGVVNYLLDTLITIVIVMTFKTTINLGLLTTLFSVCSIISLYIFQNKIKNKKLSLKLAGVGMMISIFLLLFNIGKITIIIYNFCGGVFLILLKNSAAAKKYNLIDNIKGVEEQYLVEHQVMAEVKLNCARIIGYMVLFVVSWFNNMVIFKVLLFMITIVTLLYSRLIIRLEEK